MTDEEILQAAKCCKISDCSHCPFGAHSCKCLEKFAHYIAEIDTKKEPAPAGAGTSSDNNISDNKYNIALRICQESIGDLCDCCKCDDPYIAGWTDVLCNVIEEVLKEEK